MITADKSNAVSGTSKNSASKNKAKSPSETPEQFEFAFSDNHGRRLLTKRELAAALNVCERTIDNWVAQKRIPYLRLSARLLRFNLAKVEAALARYEVKEVGARR